MGKRVCAKWHEKGENDRNWVAKTVTLFFRPNVSPCNDGISFNVWRIVRITLSKDPCGTPLIMSCQEL